MDRIHFHFGIFLSLFAFGSGLCQASPLTLEQFQKEMHKQVGRLSRKDSVSLDMRVLQTGQTLFSSGEGKALVPASTMKVFTTLTALDKLGESFRFSTSVFGEGKVQDGTLQGNIVIQGSGDPYLVSERLWLLARDVARQGIRHVTGGVKVDDSAFAGNYLGLIDWNGSREPFMAVVSATGVDFNSVEVHIIPSPNGERPRAELGPVPHAYVTLVNKLKSTSGAKSVVSIQSLPSENGHERFELTGKVGREAEPTIVYASVRGAAPYVAEAFAALLRAEGVEIAKGYLSGPAPAGVPERRLLARQESLPLLDLTKLYNTYSNNFMAEEVFLGLGVGDSGEPASQAKSQQAVLSYLRQTPSCSETQVDNGSGLSWKTHASAKCFMDLFQNVFHNFRTFADLLASMPIGGRTGTLKNRFQHVSSSFVPEKVRAKTGTLWSKQTVTSLVGFTQAASGEILAFAILQNDQRGDEGLLQGMRDWEDNSVDLMQRLVLH